MHFTCVSEFLEIVGLFIYLKSIVLINVLGKLFKNTLISTQNKQCDDFLYLKSVPVQQKNGCILKFAIIYCKTNYWSYCHKYVDFPASCAHDTQISKTYPM